MCEIRGEALGTLQALGALETLGAFATLVILETLGTLEILENLGNLVTLGTRRNPWEPLELVGTLGNPSSTLGNPWEAYFNSWEPSGILFQLVGTLRNHNFNSQNPGSFDPLFALETPRLRLLGEKRLLKNQVFNNP